jgi:hypothetical protein
MFLDLFLSSFHSPSNFVPLARVRVPCPSDNPSLKFPSYFCPEGQVNVSWPFLFTYFYSPAYLCPSDKIKVPWPWYFPSLYSPSYNPTSFPNWTSRLLDIWTFLVSSLRNNKGYKRSKVIFSPTRPFNYNINPYLTWILVLFLT